MTPNPAIDVSTSTAKLAPFTKLRCAPPRQDPGGGGINVARVIARLGGEVTAIYPAGGSTGQLLCRLMDREGVQSLAIPTLEETREDFTIFEEATKQQYRFVLPGAHVNEGEWQKCLSVLASVQPRPNFVVASGSLPLGAPQDFFGRVAHAAKGMDAKVVIDTSGVGAGDSFLGSMVWSLANHNGLDTALRYGVAGGSAALLRPGTELCRRDDVERFFQSATLRPISAQN